MKKICILSLCMIFLLNSIGFIVPASAAESNYTVFETFEGGIGTGFSGNAEACNEGLYGKCARLAYGSSQASLTYTFDTALADNIYTIEIYTKTQSGFSVSVTNDVNAVTNLIGINSEGVVGYYTKTSRGAWVLKTPDANCVVDMANAWSKVKVSINKTANQITVTTGTASYTADITVPANVKTIKVENNTGYSGETLIDEFKVYGNTNGCSAEFKNDVTTAQGGVFYTASKTKESDAQKLVCAVQAEGDASNYNLTRANGTIYVDLDADMDISCIGYNQVSVEATYIDKDYGWFALKYNTAEGIKYTDAVCLLDSGETKTHRFLVDDAVVNATGTKWDFELVTYTTNKDGKISSGDRTYSKFPVLIKSILIADTGISSEVTVGIAGTATGNIFFGDEVPQFDISLNNRSSSDTDVTAIVRVYKYNTQMQPTLVMEKSFDKSIAANGNQTLEVFAPVSAYGLYEIEVNAVNQSLGINTKEAVPFSKSMRNDTLNSNLGITGNMSGDKNIDAKEGFSLLKNAGFGMERDDFSWSDYEFEVAGSYELTERQEEILNAGIDTGIRIFPILHQSTTVYDYGRNNYQCFLDAELSKHYGNFAYNFVKEPLVQQAVDAVEIWNEPDLKSIKPDGRTLFGSEDADWQEKGELYAESLKQAYAGIKKAEKEIGKEYKVVGFSLTSYGSENMKFLDAGLDYLNGEQAFDTISIHPYTKDSPERGYDSSGNPGTQYDYVPMRYEIARSMVQGTPRIYDGEPVIGSHSNDEGVIKGYLTDKTYDYDLTDGMYLSELGYSTAIYDLDGLCVGDEYSQAERLVRYINTARDFNFDDKVFVYGFIDGGNRINEKEYNFGILHSLDSTVPYSAKMGYLAIAAYNRITSDAVDCEEVYGDSNNRAFITRYDFENTNKKVYFCVSTVGSHDVEFNFGSNLKYYDLFGNEIEPRTVTKNYILSQKTYHIIDRNAYYIVADGDLASANAEKLNVQAYVEDGGIGIGGGAFLDIEESQAKLKLTFEGLTTPQNYTAIFAYYKDGMLTDLKTKSDVKNSTDSIVAELKMSDYATDKDYDEMKMFVWDGGDKLKSLTKPVKLE